MLKTTLPVIILLSLMLCLFPGQSPGTAAQKEIRLYIDADFSHAVSSSRSIEQGIRVALSEVGNMLDGHQVTLVPLDHRGNSRRSLDNIKTYLADDRGLAVFAGLHSPPLLSNLKFINENEALHLVSWAAAGPITRYGAGPNWVFRLSIDDSKAGEILVMHAIDHRHFTTPALLLEETGWGRSNAATIGAALSSRSQVSAGVFWFKWGTKENSARMILRKLLQSGADSILLVANSPEGKMFAKVMADFPPEQRLPFFSHWGITGGDFSKIIHAGLRSKVDLSFLQTTFSFVSNPDHPMGQRVLNQAKTLLPDTIRAAEDITAPAGFVHAYDLTRILIAAVKKIGFSDNIKRDRARLRDALEHIDTPVKGLIKTYTRPFSPFAKDHPDAHEALSLNDFTMARYDEQNRIILLQR